LLKDGDLKSLSLSKEEAMELAIYLVYSIIGSEPIYYDDESIQETVNTLINILEKIINLYPDIVENPEFPQTEYNNLKRKLGYVTLKIKPEMSKRKMFKKLKTKGIDEIVEEIIDLLKEEYPEILEILLEENLPDEIIDIFLRKYGIKSFYDISDPEIKLKIKYARVIANDKIRELLSNEGASSQFTKKVQYDLLNKSYKEIATEIIDFFKEEFIEEIDELQDFSLFLQIFWKRKGLKDMYRLDPELKLKIIRAERFAKRLIESERYKEEEFTKSVHVSPKALDELKKKKSEEIIKEILDGVDKKEILNPRFGYEFLSNELILKYLLSKGIKINGRLDKLEDFDSEIYSKMIKVRQKLPREISKKKVEIFKQIASDFFEWTKKEKIEKISEGHIRRFLLERGVPKLRVNDEKVLFTLMREKCKRRKK